MAACLRDKGWNADSDPTAGVTATYPEVDEERFSSDFTACNREVGLSGPVLLSERQWTALYADYIEAISCLESIGVEMPEPVDEARFRADGLGSHFAYQGLPASYLPKLSELEAKCPQPEVR